MKNYLDSIIIVLKNILENIKEGDSQNYKVDDVKVDGVSVVTNKVANVSLSGCQKSQYKANSITDRNKTSNTYYPSTKAVADYVSNQNYITVSEVEDVLSGELYKIPNSRAVADYVDPIKAKVDELELFKFPNATIFGQPTIQQGQVSNFTSDNYLQFPFVVDLRDKAWTLEFSITSYNLTRDQQNIFDSDYGFACAMRDGNLIVAVSDNGTSWKEEYALPIAIVEGTVYIKLEQSEPNPQYLGDETIAYYYGVEPNHLGWKDAIRLDSRVPFPKTIKIGNSMDGTHPFQGIINLNDAKLTVNGNVIWQGMDDAGLSTRLAVNLNNIDADGETKINNMIDAKLGTVDTALTQILGDE